MRPDRTAQPHFIARDRVKLKSKAAAGCLVARSGARRAFAVAAWERDDVADREVADLVGIDELPVARVRDRFQVLDRARAALGSEVDGTHGEGVPWDGIFEIVYEC